MARFGSANLTERFFGAAVYLFAIYDALPLASGLLTQFPALEPFFSLLLVLVTPVSLIYGIFNSIIPVFGSLVVFFVLFIAVVRNERVAYFIRFNTLQSVLFGIAISLISIVFGSLNALNFIAGIVFILATGASLFCMVESALGRYPEIPTVSAAVYSQLPRY